MTDDTFTLRVVGVLPSQEEGRGVVRFAFQAAGTPEIIIDLPYFDAAGFDDAVRQSARHLETAESPREMPLPQSSNRPGLDVSPPTRPPDSNRPALSIAITPAPYFVIAPARRPGRPSQFRDAKPSGRASIIEAMIFTKFRNMRAAASLTRGSLAGG